MCHPFSLAESGCGFVCRTGKVIHELASLPLAEDIPIAFNSCRQGPRSVGWRSDKPAELVWTEAQVQPPAPVPLPPSMLLLHALPFAAVARMVSPAWHAVLAVIHGWKLAAGHSVCKCMQAKAAQLHIDQSHLQAGCLSHTLSVLLLSASTSSPAENWQIGEQD